MLAVHSALRTWSRRVDVFVTVSQFASAKLVETGVPAERIVRRPNFLHPDPGDRAPGPGEDFVLFAGRLSPEKGIDTLLDACRAAPDVDVRIAGDGPMRDAVERAAAAMPNVTVLGSRERPEVLALMRQARALVVPSIWYEHFPFVLLEAFASGLPAIASDLGSTAEIVGGNGAGVLFRAGDAGDLAGKLRWAVARPDEVAPLGRKARATFEADLSSGPAYERLMGAYDQARRQAAGLAG
jgi:glycosyltransferase involved in cell wall biosynthesis